MGLVPRGPFVKEMKMSKRDRVLAWIAGLLALAAMIAVPLVARTS